MQAAWQDEIGLQTWHGNTEIQRVKRFMVWHREASSRDNIEVECLLIFVTTEVEE